MIRSISAIFPSLITNVIAIDSRRCETTMIPTFPFTSASAICDDWACRAPASAPLATTCPPTCESDQRLQRLRRLHASFLKKAGETDERLFAVAAWREAPYFTDAERAVLALTEAVTRLSDQANAVPDEIWDEAARHFDEPVLAALILSIATVNLWNHLNVATRQVAGEWMKSAGAKAWVEKNQAGVH